MVEKERKKTVKATVLLNVLNLRGSICGKVHVFSLCLSNGRSILYSCPGSIFKFLIQLCGKTMSLLQTPTLPPSLNVVSLKLAGVSFRDGKALEIKG